MNDATLQDFRDMAETMRGAELADWQWLGPHMSQRMFGITRTRAEQYAERHGGKAERMPEACPKCRRPMTTCWNDSALWACVTCDEVFPKAL